MSQTGHGVLSCSIASSLIAVQTYIQGCAIKLSVEVEYLHVMNVPLTQVSEIALPVIHLWAQTITLTYKGRLAEARNGYTDPAMKD